jgi:hypothetical protein
MLIFFSTQKFVTNKNRETKRNLYVRNNDSSDLPFIAWQQRCRKRTKKRPPEFLFFKQLSYANALDMKSLYLPFYSHFINNNV